MNERKKIIGLVIVITFLLVTYHLNCMLYNSFAASYYQKKKKLLHMVALTALKRNRFRKERKPREYWVAPGRTQAWWDNFISGTVLQHEWKHNFRMSKENFYKLCEEL